MSALPWRVSVFRREMPLFFVCYLSGLAIFWFAHSVGLPGVPIPALVILFVVVSMLLWVMGPVRRVFRRMSKEDFCVSCRASLEGPKGSGECPICGKDIAESLRLLQVSRDSPEYAHMERRDFGWRSVIPSSSLWAERIDSRMSMQATLIYFAGVALLVYVIDERMKGWPHWLRWLLVAILAVVWPAIIFSSYRLGPARRFRRRLTEEDFCMYCEYSFQGHGKEGVCPECGKDIAKSIRILEWYRNAPWWVRVFI